MSRNILQCRFCPTVSYPVPGADPSTAVQGSSSSGRTLSAPNRVCQFLHPTVGEYLCHRCCQLPAVSCSALSLHSNMMLMPVL